jgi:hypothetical protein
MKITPTHLLIMAIPIGSLLGYSAHKYEQSVTTQNLINNALKACDKNENTFNLQMCIHNLEQAVERESLIAAFHLGNVYEKIGDLEKSIYWHNISANKGHRGSISILGTEKFKQGAGAIRSRNNTPNEEDWGISDKKSNCYPPYKCIIEVVARWRFSDEYIKHIYDTIFNSRPKTKMDSIEVVLPCMSKTDGWPYRYIVTHDKSGTSEPLYYNDFHRVNTCEEYKQALLKHRYKRKTRMIDLEDFDSHKLCGEFIKNKYSLMAYAIVGPNKPKTLKTKNSRRYVQISINISQQLFRDDWRRVICSTPLSLSEYHLYDNTGDADIQLHK